MVLFINNNIKIECVEARSLLIFASNSRSKQNKKNTEPPFVDMSTKVQQKILNAMVVGARQSFQFSRQKTWFLESNRVLSKFLHEVSHYLIRIIKS